MPANSIRSRRKRAGLSQQELAYRAQCSVAMLSLLERGLTVDKSEVRDRILAVLDEAERIAA